MGYSTKTVCCLTRMSLFWEIFSHENVVFNTVPSFLINSLLNSFFFRFNTNTNNSNFSWVLASKGLYQLLVMRHRFLARATPCSPEVYKYNFSRVVNNIKFTVFSEFLELFDCFKLITYFQRKIWFYFKNILQFRLFFNFIIVWLYKEIIVLFFIFWKCCITWDFIDYSLSRISILYSFIADFNFFEL